MLFDAYVETIGDRSAVYVASCTLCGGEVAPYPGSFLDGALLGVWPRVIFVDNDRAFRAARLVSSQTRSPQAYFLTR
jgi:hypothetical protein